MYDKYSKQQLHYKTILLNANSNNSSRMIQWWCMSSTYGHPYKFGVDISKFLDKVYKNSNKLILFTKFNVKKKKLKVLFYYMSCLIIISMQHVRSLWEIFLKFNYHCNNQTQSSFFLLSNICYFAHLLLYIYCLLYTSDAADE